MRKKELNYDRYLQSYTQDALREKLVFIGGPRQVGKTTMALHLVGASLDAKPDYYLNWDISEHKARILKNELNLKSKTLVFDEIHKYAKWRRFLKGFYDEFYPRKNAIVTGSARLDFYRKGGDSLQGRYRYFRLHPYSLRELSARPNSNDTRHLLQYSGFPEPLSYSDETRWRLWQRERIEKVVYADLRDLERVQELSLVDLLIESLPERIGSPLSIQNLREDLEVSHDTVKRWITILENLYMCFRVAPFGSSKIRAVKKEQKLYFWDWTQAHDPGARFENLVACQLLKFCHYKEDTEGYRMDLRYIRDTDGREVDFVVLQDKKPLFAIECKFSDTALSKTIGYFQERTEIPHFYQVHAGVKDFGHSAHGGRVLGFHQLVTELELP